MTFAMACCVLLTGGSDLLTFAMDALTLLFLSDVVQKHMLLWTPVRD